MHPDHDLQVHTGIRGLRLSATLVLAGAMLSGPVAMLLVAHFAPQPPWSGVEAFAEHYRPLQLLPYVLGYLLLGGFVLFAAACHALARPTQRLRTSAALIFTGIYGSLVFTNYTLQLAYVPRVLGGRPPWVAQLTMANPASFAWFLEMFGYAALGVATWLLADGFGAGRRGGAVRWLLKCNGAASIVGAACTAIWDQWVFSTAGLLSFAGWNLLVATCFFLVAIAPDGAHGAPP